MTPREIANVIKQLMMDPSRHPVQYGVVVDVDEETGLVKCRLEPSEDPEIFTDFIRYLGPGIAFGKWKGIYLPENGTEVLLLAADPDCKGYIAIGGLYNDEDLPPEGYKQGTILWQHTETGNKFLMDDDGMIYVGDKEGALRIVFDTWIENYFNPLVDKLDSHISAFNGHMHTGNMGAPTTPPLSPDTPAASFKWSDGDVSTKFKGV